MTGAAAIQRQHGRFANWLSPTIVWSIIKRSMGVGEDAGLVSAESSISHSEHEVKCFRLSNFCRNDCNMFPQLSLPVDSGFRGQRSASSPMRRFYIPSQSQAKPTPPSSAPSMRAPCAILSLHPLSRSQRNYGRLDLSGFFSQEGRTASVHVVSHGIRDSYQKVVHLRCFRLLA